MDEITGYHLCSPDHRDEVRRRGLVPTEPGGGAPPGVYLWLRADLIPRELEKARRAGEPRDVWEARVARADLVPDPELPPGHAARLPYAVPAGRVRLARAHGGRGVAPAAT
jgi:hypothetical protein